MEDWDYGRKSLHDGSLRIFAWGVTEYGFMSGRGERSLFMCASLRGANSRHRDSLQSRGYAALRAPSPEGQINHLIPPFVRLRCRPHEQQRLDDRTNGSALLGKYKHAWGWHPGIEAIAKIPGHRVAVVGDQNTILLSRKFEDLLIRGSPQSSSLHIEDV